MFRLHERGVGFRTIRISRQRTRCWPRYAETAGVPGLPQSGPGCGQGAHGCSRGARKGGESQDGRDQARGHGRGRAASRAAHRHAHDLRGSGACRPCRLRTGECVRRGAAPGGRACSESDAVRVGAEPDEVSVRVPAVAHPPAGGVGLVCDLPLREEAGSARCRERWRHGRREGAGRAHRCNGGPVALPDGLDEVRGNWMTWPASWPASGAGAGAEACGAAMRLIELAEARAAGRTREAFRALDAPAAKSATRAVPCGRGWISGVWLPVLVNPLVAEIVAVPSGGRAAPEVRVDGRGRGRMHAGARRHDGMAGWGQEIAFGTRARSGSLPRARGKSSGEESRNPMTLKRSRAGGERLARTGLGRGGRWSRVGARGWGRC